MLYYRKCRLAFSKRFGLGGGELNYLLQQDFRARVLLELDTITNRLDQVKG